jgi:hypothetical protein
MSHAEYFFIKIIGKNTLQGYPGGYTLDFGTDGSAIPRRKEAH